MKLTMLGLILFVFMSCSSHAGKPLKKEVKRNCFDQPFFRMR